MKTTIFHRPGTVTASLAAAMMLGLACAAALTWSGCTFGGGGTEGNRCVPSLSHDECNSGLTCVTGTYTPAAGGGYFTCGESYCCPGGPSASGYCNGASMAPNADGTLQCPGYCTDPSTRAAVLTLPVPGVLPDGGLQCPNAGSSSSSSGSDSGADASRD